MKSPAPSPGVKMTPAPMALRARLLRLPYPKTRMTPSMNLDQVKFHMFYLVLILISTSIASDEPMDDMEDGQANTEDDSRDSDTEVGVSDAEDEPEAAQEPPESTTQATVQTPQTDSALGGMEAIAERGGTGSSGTASGGTSGGPASGGPASGGMASGWTGAGGAASGGLGSGGADKPVPEPITETLVPDAPARPQEKVSEANVALAPTTATGVAGGPPIAVIGATPQALQEQGTPPSLPSQCLSPRLNTLEQAGIGRHLCSQTPIPPAATKSKDDAQEPDERSSKPPLKCRRL
ncbi:hypothetical protein DXG01_002454 [Tephrocybe rancida]|nr:hypothetical protein DXG01_002454 [Tephrocybe rancida]